MKPAGPLMAEQQDMLEQFREFDRNMIHVKYRAVVEQRETIRSH